MSNSSDCSLWTVQILHLLGNEGPKTADPSKYIRYVYNRVILENATVRASAVSALAKFGAVVDGLKPRILVLLRRCLYDNDDEVPTCLTQSEVIKTFFYNIAELQ